MNEELFRKKSLDKVKSPENLDDYIRVSNPGVWLLLISVIVLLAGVCVWGIYGRIDSTISTTVQVENGTASCFVSGENMSSVKTGLTVRFDDKEAVITEISKADNGYVCNLSLDSAPYDGFYEGKIIVTSYSPISFVLN